MPTSTLLCSSPEAGDSAHEVTRLGARVVVGGARLEGELEAAGVRDASALIPVIVADATAEETLDLAGASKAAVVLALTDSDAVNLHVALRVRRDAPGVPVVIRLLSPELARHVAERHEARVASPVAIASQEFARAALAACENAAARVGDSRSATGSPGRSERGGVGGAMSGPPT